MNAHIDVTDVILETERLILRPWTMNDLDDFYEYASQSGVDWHTDRDVCL